MSILLIIPDSDFIDKKIMDLRNFLPYLLRKCGCPDFLSFKDLKLNDPLH